MLPVGNGNRGRCVAYGGGNIAVNNLSGSISHRYLNDDVLLERGNGTANRTTKVVGVFQISGRQAFTEIIQARHHYLNLRGQRLGSLLGGKRQLAVAVGQAGAVGKQYQPTI